MKSVIGLALGAVMIYVWIVSINHIEQESKLIKDRIAELENRCAK